MPLPLLASAAVSLVPSLFSAIRGGSQRRQAERLRASAVNPGYQMNQGVVDNARILQDRYSNYQIPGYGKALENLNQSYDTSFDRGVQGATSGGDVLDLATKLAYGKGEAVNQLAYQNAQGKDQAMGQYLNANAQAGQEMVNKNAYDRDQYQRQLNEAASLYNAGEQNIGNALNDVSQIGTTLLMNGAMGGSNNKRKYINPNLRGQYAGLNTNNINFNTNLPY